MNDVLKTSSAWLEAMRHRHRTVPIAYRRGENMLPLLATIGKTEFETDDGAGAVIRSESRDFLIRTAEIALFPPVAGDLIVETDGTQELLFEVAAPPSQPVWRYSDAYRRTLRIHTKFVKSQAAT